MKCLFKHIIVATLVNAAHRRRYFFLYDAQKLRWAEIVSGEATNLFYLGKHFVAFERQSDERDGSVCRRLHHKSIPVSILPSVVRN